MSYYRPSFSQTVAMSRGGGRGFSSARGGSSYRGNSTRGSSWGSSRGGYNNTRGTRFSSSFSSNSFDSRSNKYPVSDKYGASRAHNDDYRKSYKTESYPSSRDHRSPERKRLRHESSHDRSFGGSGDYNNRSYDTDRRSFSGDRRPAPFVRKEEFRKPTIPRSPRGGYRGRISSRGSMRARLRDRPARRRLVDASYAVRTSRFVPRTSDFARRLKISKMRSSIIRHSKKDVLSDKEESENEEEEEDEEKKATKEDEKETSEKEEGEEDEVKASPKKTPKKEKEEGAASEKEEGEGEDEEKKKTFIKLVCPHCTTRCITFGKYSMHLQSGRHAVAMRKVAMKQKSIISQMRLVQRKAQRDLESKTDDLALRTSWCPLCKLNYKQPKLTHQSSSAHRAMKKFLMPFCKICKITFKSPMIYESHCCSIDHIKRKAIMSNGNKSDEAASGTEEDVMENFMTIDSVGDVDEEGESAEKKEGGETKAKEHINVGIEKVRKVEVHYCDLCRMYLPRVSDEKEMNKLIALHCKHRTHLQKYIRYKEDMELAKRAERLQRKETADKEKKDKDEPKEAEEKKVATEGEGEAAEVKPDTEVVEGEEGEKKADGAATEDEKMWADVDKDLGDILAEAGSGNKSSDEDEEESGANGERYDRFKYSEKTGDELKKAVVAPEEIEEEKKMETEDVEAEK